LVIKFSEKLDAESARDVENWSMEEWEYRWTSQYGSPEYSLKRPGVAGHDEVEVRGVELLEDGRSVLLKIKEVHPVMQLKVRYAMKDGSGKAFKGDLLGTVHRVR
jgi:hypothetical protein